MKKKFLSYVEPNKVIRAAESFGLFLLIAAAAVSFVFGGMKIASACGNTHFVGTLTMYRDYEEEDYDEDASVIEVIYRNGDAYMVVTYPYDEYVVLDSDKITAYEYMSDNGTALYFDHENPTSSEIEETYVNLMAESSKGFWNVGISVLVLGLGVGVILMWGKAFTGYEKSWFLTIMVSASIVAMLFPEESANGINGIVIMLLYLLDTFLNILCELLISKQSRYNFLVSVAVEITEILICLVLMYRFATMVTTLFFWLPIDILSFINWTRHPDEDSRELTAVRRLKGWHEVLIIAGIVLWTIVIGYLISGIDIQTDFFGGDKRLQTIIVYIDACASAVGVANGLFIFFRLSEQWIAWYISAFLETIINIMAGQYVLLVLKLGYFTNTTYGYIKWTRYIKTHHQENATLF